MRLAGKVALISGGARGMGAEEARLFAREGANVVFGNVLDGEGNSVEAQVREHGGAATYVHLDVVNNAGVASFAVGDDATVEDYDRFMAVNAKGTYLGIRAAIPAMRRAGGGSIVNISSISGLVGQVQVHAGYNASKGAVRIMTKSIALQYAKDGIRVNSVHPGPTADPPSRLRRQSCLSW